MRKTIKGTGGMLVVQTLKDAGVEYLFSNPGSAETGIFAALAEDDSQRLVVAKHEGVVSAMADGYNRASGKIGVIIAHVMGGSFQLAGQLYNAQMAGSSILIVSGDWASPNMDFRPLAPYPGLGQAEAMRAVMKEGRCAYEVESDPKALTWATARAIREALTAPTGPVYLSIGADLLNRDGLEAEIGAAAQYQLDPLPSARPETVVAIARKLGEARCPLIIFGDDVWRHGAQADAVQLAELLEAPVVSGRQIFANFPTRHPLYCGTYPLRQEFSEMTGLNPDVLFLVGCQGLHGTADDIPYVMQIGPNTTLMGRHYPLDLVAQCELKGTLQDICDTFKRLHSSETIVSGQHQRGAVRNYANLLIERELTVVREHEGDKAIHPSLLEVQMSTVLPRETMMVMENPTARSTLIPFGHEDMSYMRSGGGSLGWGLGGAIGAKLGLGDDDRPVVLSIGDGSLTYSASGFWTMARYNIPILTIVSNNDTYQVVRQNWAREAPDSVMVREGKYPGIFLNSPRTDYVELAHSQGVDGVRVTEPAKLEAVIQQGLARVTEDKRPYVIDVAIQREGVGADSDWHQGWQA